MSDGLFLDHDSLTGRVRRFHVLPNDQYAVESSVDVEPVIEQNKALAGLQDSTWRDNSNLVASIPGPIYGALLRTWREQGLSREERQKALHKWLNDSDNKLFRIKAGRL
jgi:hypothetical protein